VKAIVFELFAKEYEGHGLRELLGYLSKLLRESDYNELAERIDEHIRNNRSLLVDLENSYIDARYGDFEYDKQIAQKLLELVSDTVCLRRW